MEIERINENTVKFFLSYIDIEERGFTREEVWYNRDKSEELFWEMMDEVSDESEFEVEGPLWIQVHAMSGGIEVTVTRAQMSENGDPLESPFTSDDPRKMFQHGKMYDHDEDDDDIMPGLEDNTFEWLDNMFVFSEFDDLIPLADRMLDYEVETSLYSFENNYYLYLKYDTEAMDDSRKTDLFSVLSEFGVPSNMTIHRIEEYGNLLMEADVFSKIQKYFGAK
jgi:adapter protein MecA 1/2